MKKTILFAIMLIAANALFGQLKVDSLGRTNLKGAVSIAATPTYTINARLVTYGTIMNSLSSSRYGIYSTLTTSYSSNLFGGDISITGYVDASQQTSSLARLYKVGVLGKVKKTSVTSNCLGAGVAGLASPYGGVGVYGSTSLSLPTTWSGSYAGYFSGDVKATGTIFASTFTTTSDLRLKDNVKPLTDVSAIYSLNPVSYTFRTEDTLHIRFEESSNEGKKIHYGLIAQEVKDVFPDLVHEEEDGYLSVNYVEMIPFLIRSIQELNAKVEKQSQLIEQLRGQTNAPLREQTINENMLTDAYFLAQNNPNPFSESTFIGYAVPADYTSAYLTIIDSTGKNVSSYNLSNADGVVEIKGYSLPAGNYFYSLVIDGKVIDTKQMILTK